MSRSSYLANVYKPVKMSRHSHSKVLRVLFLTIAVSRSCFSPSHILVPIISNETTQIFKQFRRCLHASIKATLNTKQNKKKIILSCCRYNLICTILLNKKKIYNEAAFRALFKHKKKFCRQKKKNSYFFANSFFRNSTQC